MVLIQDKITGNNHNSLKIKKLLIFKTTLRFSKVNIKRMLRKKEINPLKRGSKKACVEAWIKSIKNTFSLNLIAKHQTIKIKNYFFIINFKRREVKI